MNHTFYITCPKGLEPLLFDELAQLGLSNLKQHVAYIELYGSLQDAYRVCLWSRLANRVLLKLAEFACHNANQLYNETKKINWLEHFNVEQTFIIDFTGTSDNLINSQFSAQKIKDAIADQFREKTGQRPSIDKEDPDLRINGRLHKDQLTLSLDLSGDSLHKRGYRTEQGVAPLKENLAAAILARAGWSTHKKEAGFVDPLCGSGTLVIEAALIAADIAPGLFRFIFGFHGWKKHDNKIWQTLLAEAKQRQENGLSNLSCSFYGSDIDNKMIEIAQQNIIRAGLENYVQLHTHDIFDLTNKTAKTNGLIVTNPPYGERLGADTPLEKLYALIAKKSREEFLNWELGIFTGTAELCSRIGLRPVKKYKFFNGTIPCELFMYKIEERYFLS